MKHFLRIFLSLFMLLNQSNAKMYLVTERGTTLTAWNTKDKACDYSAYYGAEKAKKICKKDGFVISLRTKEDKNSWRKGDCGTCKTYSSNKIKCESEGTIGCLEASFRKVNAKVFNITGKSQEKACKRAKSKAKNAARSRCSNGTQKYKLIKDKKNDISECSCQEQSSSASNSKFSCSGTHESMCKFVAKSDISKEEIKEFVERVGSIRGKNNEIREIIKSGELEGYDKERAQIATNTSDAFLDQGEKQFYEGEKELGNELISVGAEVTSLALGLTPGISIGKDAYELFSGKDLVTGRLLSMSDRAFAGLGLFTLGGSNYIKAAGKVLSKMSKFGLGDYRKAVRVASKWTNSSSKAGLFLGNKYKNFKSNSSYETAKELFRELNGKVSLEKKKKLIRSFKLKDIRFRTLGIDTKVYRWHNNNSEARLIGRFVSPERIIDSDKARKLLALPSSNRMTHFDEYIIKKGTKVFEGPVASLNGYKGGGKQIFISGKIEDLLIPIIKD